MPMAAPTELQVKVEDGEVTVTIGPRVYRVLGLEKCTSRGQMRVNVKVSGNNVRGEFCYHGDTLDMEAFRQRAAFVKQAAHELAAKEDTIHREVGQDGARGTAAGAHCKSACAAGGNIADDGRGADGRHGPVARSASVGSSA
jgi:hypothetical protein